jgi:hypothetical protein
MDQLNRYGGLIRYCTSQRPIPILLDDIQVDSSGTVRVAQPNTFLLLAQAGSQLCSLKAMARSMCPYRVVFSI